MSDEKIKQVLRENALDSAQPFLDIAHKLSVLVSLLVAKGLISLEEYQTCCEHTRAQFDQITEQFAEDKINEIVDELPEAEKALARMFFDSEEKQQS